MIQAYNLHLNKIKEDTPLIFLDIDGVLCENFDPNRLEEAPIPAAVSNFNNLVRETGAKVILSSFRTYFQSNLQVYRALVNIGVQSTMIDYIRYFNPYNVVQDKDDQISKYILNNNLKNYIVIDDYALFENISDIKKKFVKTNPMKGLTNSNVNLAKKILNDYE